MFLFEITLVLRIVSDCISNTVKIKLSIPNSSICKQFLRKIFYNDRSVDIVKISTFWRKEKQFKFRIALGFVPNKLLDAKAVKMFDMYTNSSLVISNKFRAGL